MTFTFTLSTNGNFGWGGPSENTAVSDDQNNIFIAGSYGVRRSTNGGATWSTVTPPNTSGARAMHITPTGSVLYAAGGDTKYLFKSTNLGTSWSQMNPEPLGYASTGLGWVSIDSSPDGTNVVICHAGNAGTSGGYVYYSTNAGSTWSVPTSGTNQNTLPWIKIKMNPSNPSQVIGLTDNGTTGTIRKSTDYGHNWSVITSISTGSYSPQPFASSDDFSTQILAGQSSTIAITTNGGTNWTRQTLRYLDGGDTFHFTIAAVSSDGSHLLAASASNFADGPRIFVSTNAGSNWSRHTITYSDGTLTSPQNVTFTSNGDLGLLTLSGNTESQKNSFYFMTDSTLAPDTTAPTAGNSGNLTFSSISSTGLTVNWTAATDDTTTQANLQYLLYRSTSNNLGSVANIEANGTAVGSYTANITSKAVTGLSGSTTYYFNVIVKDQAGNKTAYVTHSQQTSDGTAPTAGNSGNLTFSSVSSTGLTVNWTAATDNVTAQAGLEYLLYRSTSNNLSSVVNIEANGTAVGSYTANITSKAVTGLSDSTTYYFNVIVKDEAGNKAAYVTHSQQTSDATAPTVVVASTETLVSSFTNTPFYNDSAGVALGTTYRPATNVIISKVGLKMGRSSNLATTVTAKIYQVASYVVTTNNFNYNPSDFTLIATSTNSLSPSDFALYPAAAQMEYWTFDYVPLTQGGYYVIWAEVDGSTLGTNSLNYLAPAYASGNFPDNHYKQSQTNAQIAGDYNLSLGYEIYTGSAGNNGNLSFSSVTSSGLTLSWTAATDNISSASALEYLPYYSTSNNLDTVSNIEGYGTAVGSYTANITSKAVTGLSDGYTYYFNVIVKDEAGNKTAYNSNSQATPDATGPSISYSTLSFSSITSSSITVNWSATATDNVTNQASLEYRAYYSTSSNLSSVADILAYGTGIGSFMPLSSSAVATGLSENTNYYFNVIVQDGYGNKSAYSIGSQVTLSSTNITSTNNVVSGTTTWGAGSNLTLNVDGYVQSGGNLTLNISEFDAVSANGHFIETLPGGSLTLGQWTVSPIPRTRHRIKIPE